MSRAVFTPTPFSRHGAEVAVHPVVLLTGFAALSLATGLVVEVVLRLMKMSE